MPEHKKNRNKTIKAKNTKVSTNGYQVKKTLKQKAGSSDICSKDINQLLMGNPPTSIGNVDIEEIWKDTKRTAKDLDKYGKKGWGNYPGRPPQPDCTIL